MTSNLPQHLAAALIQSGWIKWSDRPLEQKSRLEGFIARKLDESNGGAQAGDLPRSRSIRQTGHLSSDYRLHTDAERNAQAAEIDEMAET